MRLKLLISVGLTLSILSANIFAYGGSSSDAHVTRVKINNQTGSLCKIKNQSIVYGGITSSTLPESIDNNDADVFEMTSSIFGSDVILTYSCGDNDIQFEVKQDYSWFAGNEPSAIMLAAASGLIMKVTKAESSSWSEKKKGILNILLQQAGH